MATIAAVAACVAAAPAAADDAPVRDFTFTFMLLTFSDDDSMGHRPHIWTVDQLRQAGTEIENYFRLVSNGKLRLHVRAAAAPDLGTRASYTTSTQLMDAALDSAHNNGYDAAIAGTEGLYMIYRGYTNALWCNAYYWSHPVSHQITGVLHQMAVQEGCIGSTRSPDPAGRSGVEWSGFEQEVGHALQAMTGRQVIHPAGYGDSFNMMDSCYPCSESAFDLAPASIVGGNIAPFPGWLPASKYRTLAIPASGGTSSATITAVEADPATTSLPQGLKVPLAPIDVPVGDGRRFRGERYYMLSLHKRLRAGAYGQPGEERMVDEGVEIHEVMESRRPPVQMVPPCEQEPAPTRCVYLPGAAHDGDFCNANAMSRPPECWPYRLWHAGEVFRGLAATDITFGARTPAGDQPVTVSRAAASGPDPFIIPDHTPPMHTAETVDLWIDSSCNGYEYNRSGRFFLRNNPSALRAGRRSGDTFESQTVIANGDPLCGNHENRIYARIHNAGNRTARNARVKLAVSRAPAAPGGDIVWEELGSTPPVDVLPGRVREVFVTFNPALPLWRGALDIRADLSGEDVGLPSTLHAEERINVVEDPERLEALRRRLERYRYLAYPIPDLPVDPLDDPPYFNVRAIPAPGSRPGLSLDPLAFVATPGKTTRVPLEFEASRDLRPGQQFVMNVMTDRMHVEAQPGIPPTWSAPPLHSDPETILQRGVIYDVVRPSRLTVDQRRHGRRLTVSGRLTPGHRTTVAIDLLRGTKLAATHLVLTDAKGRFSLRVRRKDAARLRAQAIFLGDRTTLHAISGPQADSKLPPPPTPLSKLPKLPAMPGPLRGDELTANLSIACDLKGNTLTVSGSLAPAQATTIELQYTRGGGQTTTRFLTTSASGAYSDSIDLGAGETSSAVAHWGGDLSHFPTSAGPCQATAPGTPPGPDQRPDLVISKVFQQTPDQSDISFTVTNQGKGNAGPFTVGVSQSQGQAPDSVAFQGLAAGQSANGQVVCRGGDITITADPGQQVAETDETNNGKAFQQFCGPG